MTDTKNPDAGRRAALDDFNLFMFQKMGAAAFNEETVKTIRAALAQSQPPDGWVMMPREINDDMVVAFAETWFSKKRCIDDCEMEDCYRAMIAAAPKAKPPEQGQVEAIAALDRAYGEIPDWPINIDKPQLPDGYEWICLRPALGLGVSPNNPWWIRVKKLGKDGRTRIVRHIPDYFPTAQDAINYVMENLKP